MTFKVPPLTLAQAREIARSIHALRRDWDRPGIEDALGRARFLGDPMSIAIAAHRAAADPANRTPAVIALQGAHWREASKPPHFPPPASHERCSVCSETEDKCRRVWGRDHDFLPDVRRQQPAPVEPVAELRQLVDDRPERACSEPGCFRPTRDGICDRCRAATVVDIPAANAELIERLHANERERARTRPEPDPDAPPPRLYTSADYDPEKVHAAQAQAALDRRTNR